MNNSQEFTDIVCAQNRAKVKFLLHVTQIDTPVFHLSGIAAAGCIHCQCLTDNLRWNGLFLLLAAGMIGSFLLYLVLGRHIDGLLGLLPCSKPFVYGTFPAFDLLFTSLPGVINSRVESYPNNIVSGLCHNNWFLHTLGNLDAQQAHAKLDDLANVLCQNQTEHLEVAVGLFHDAEVMVELVELLGQVIAVVGND